MAIRPVHGISLCAGAGGLDLGLELAEPGYRTVCYVEWEAYAASVLVARMEDEALGVAPVWDDVGTFDGRPWRGAVDLIAAGYPCQPFSVAGRRLGAEDERHIWPDVARVVGEVQPEWCFFENVEGHVRLGYWDHVRPELESLGYEVEEGLFTASEVGAPHGRARLFILAHRTGERGEGERMAVRGVHHPDGSGPDLVNPAHVGHERAGGTRGRGTRPEDSGRVVMGHADITGLEGRGHERLGSADERPAWTSGVPLFPPGPGERERWAAVLAERPDLAPAVESGVRHLADGLAGGMEFRTERLRLLGNGVVPLQAAYAYLVLRGRFQ